MHDEPYTRSEGGSAPSEAAGDDASVPPAARVGQVESVPSEQLWRAAILAARQAAVSAAELRRELEERGPPAGPPIVPPIVPPESGPAARLLT